MESHINKQNMMGFAWESFVRDTADIVFLKNSELIYINASQGFSDMVGLPSPQDVVGKTDFEIFADQDLALRYTQDDKRLMEEGGGSEPYIEPIPAKNGIPRYASTQKTLIRDESGSVIGLIGISRDVTYEYESKRVYQREMRGLLTFGEGTFAIALVDVTAWHLRFLQCRDPSDPLSMVGDGGLERFLELSAQLAPEVSRFYQALDQQTAWELFNSGRQTVVREYRRRHADDTYRWMRDEVRFIIEPVSGHLEAVITLQDIEGKKQEQTALQRAAERDAMTGLFHNRAAMRQIKRFLEQEGAGGNHALFIIDLDNFKSINDTFGHRMGDEVILDTAHAIQRVFRESDIVGRIGGDEYIVLMKNVGRLDNVRQKGEALVQALQYTCRDDVNMVELTGSVGISLYHGDGQTSDDLYEKADAALYRAKSMGKNSYLIAGEAQPAQESAITAEHGSAMHLQFLLENMDGCVLVCRVDQEISFTYASPNTAQRMGWDPTWTSLEMENSFSAILPQDQEPLRCAIIRAAQEEEVLDCTFRILSQEGEPRWWRMRGNRLPPREGAGCEMILVATDVTCLKEREEALQFSKLRYRTAVEQSDLMLWEVDLKKGTLRYTGELARRLGIEGRVYRDLPTSFLQTGILQPQSEAVFCRAMKNLFAGNDREEYAMEAVDRKGRILPLKGHFRLLKNEEGAPYCAVGVIRPIFYDSQELDLYRKVTRGGVFSAEVLGAPRAGEPFRREDIDLAFQYGSSRFFAIQGYTRQSMEEKLQNRCLGCLLPADRQRVRELMGQALSQGRETGSYRVRILTEDGTERRIQATALFQWKNDRPWIVGVVIPEAEPDGAALQELE